MPLTFGTPAATFWYPRIAWGSIVDFDDPAKTVKIIRKPIHGTNTSVSGLQETLHERFEDLVVLGFGPLSTAMLDTLATYVYSWGLLGKPAALILDRLFTCTTQWEYRFNTSFTQAILQNDPFQPERYLLSRPFYQIELVFRQEGGA